MVAASVLSGNWIVACTSSQLKSKPVPRTVLGCHVVLFRKPGGVSALLDCCPHRSAPLSAGRIVNDCIQCPYHGWQFDAAGRCTARPGVLDPVSALIQVDSFPCIEKDGLVWICLNSHPSPDTPADNRWYADTDFESFTLSSKVQASMADAMENLLDGTHTPFVHSGLVRSRTHQQKFSAVVRVRSQMVEVEYRGETQQQGLISRLFERDRTVSFGRFIPPCLVELEYRSARGAEFVLNSYFTPQDEQTIIVHSGIFVRRTIIPLWFKRLLLYPFLNRVLIQDQAILQLQQENIRRFGRPRHQSWEGDLLRGWIDTWLRNGNLPEAVPEQTIQFEL